MNIAGMFRIVRTPRRKRASGQVVVAVTLVFLTAMLWGCNLKPRALILSPSADSIEIAKGETVTFQGIGVGGLPLDSGDNGNEYGYSWGLDGNEVGEGNDTTSDTVTVTFNSLGAYTIAFTVTDRNESRDTAFVKVAVTEGTAQEDLDALILNPVVGAINVAIGATVQFKGGGTGGVPFRDDDGNEIYSYFWDVLNLSGVICGNGGGNGTDADTENDESIALTFNGSGSFPITLTVQDRRGVTDTATVTVNVDSDASDSALSAIILTPPLETFETKVNQNITFYGKALNGKPFGDTTTAEANQYSYFWDIFKYSAISINSGDAATQKVELKFDKAATFTIRFIVKDSNGATATDTVTVTVKN